MSLPISSISCGVISLTLSGLPLSVYHSLSFVYFALCESVISGVLPSLTRRKICARDRPLPLKLSQLSAAFCITVIASLAISCRLSCSCCARMLLRLTNSLSCSFESGFSSVWLASSLNSSPESDSIPSRMSHRFPSATRSSIYSINQRRNSPSDALCSMTLSTLWSMIVELSISSV